MNLRSIQLKPILKSKLCRSFELTFIFWQLTALGCTIFSSRFQHFGNGLCDKWLRDCPFCSFSDSDMWKVHFKKKKKTKPQVANKEAQPLLLKSILQVLHLDLQSFSIKPKVSQLSDLSSNTKSKPKTISQQDLDLAFND